MLGEGKLFEGLEFKTADLPEWVGSCEDGDSLRVSKGTTEEGLEVIGIKNERTNELYVYSQNTKRPPN